MKITQNSKKWLLFVGLIVLGCFAIGEFSLAVTNPAGVELEKELGAFDYAGSFLLKGANSVLYAIFKLTLVLLAGSMWMLDVMISPEMFTGVFFSDAAKVGINTAWAFVRDFFNLFFILIIVLVGLSTILGVGRFKDRAILMRVVFAALLINFSKPITLFVIDISQVFMRFFAESIKDMQFGAQIQNLINFESILSGTGWSLDDNFTFFVIIVTVIFMTLVMAIMLFYLSISLLIRMVSFWVLIVLSPLAMFGIAVEGTKLGNMKNEWTQSLINWCFYGPILLFFLWLSVVLVSTMTSATEAGLSTFSASSSEHLRAGAGGLSGFVVALFSTIIPYITAVYLLFYGYDKAKEHSEKMATKLLDAGSKKLEEVGSRAKKIGYQTTMPGTRKAIAGGVKANIEKYADEGSWIDKRLTQKGRDDIQAKKEATWKKRLGDDGGAALRAYDQKKAQEKSKDWKDNPPSKEDLEKMFNSKDASDKIAATLHKSQNNQLGTGKDYEQALSNLTGHKGLQEKVTRETAKENMTAVIDSERKQKIEEAKKEGGLLHGISTDDKVYEERVTTINDELYEEKLKGKNNNEVFKNQGGDFYKQKGMLDYLARRAKNQKPGSRAKFADNIKHEATKKEFMKTAAGRFLMGEESTVDRLQINQNNRPEETNEEISSLESREAAGNR